MTSIKKKLALQFGKRSVLALLVLALVFWSALAILFTQEKQRLDTEFGGMIFDSLSIHTRRNAEQISKLIRDAERALKTARTMLRNGGSDGSIPERLAPRNALAPDYPTQYLSEEELAAGALHTGEGNTRQRLIDGEAAIDIIFDAALGGHYLTVILPLADANGPAGALYTQINADDLFASTMDGVVYQNPYSCLVTGAGDIVFNTYQPDHRGNLFDDLGTSYGLEQAQVDRVAALVTAGEAGSTTFLRHGQDYFVSSAGLTYNGWRLVSVVRGPDVVLRSNALFADVVRTSVIAMLITAAAAYAILFQLVSSRKKLEQAQERNQVLTRRFQAMFEQHSALMVALDAQTRCIEDANPATCICFGIAKEDLLGRHMQEFNLLPTHVLDEQLRATASGKATFHAAPHRVKNGEIKLLDVYASIIHNKERDLIYAILFDSTDRERYREELVQEKELLRITLQSIGDGVVTTDNHGLITAMNSVAESMTGWEAGSAIGRPFTEVFVLQNEDTGEPVPNPIQRVLETGRIVGLANHTELVNRQGARTPIADSAAPIKAENGQIFGVVMVFRDVGDEKKHSREIEFLSYHDSLTGLHNRHYIEDTMARLDEKASPPIAVIMADVNGLKITNDVFGHKAGDALLKGVASLMRQCCHADHLIARWGGDEFVVFMPGENLEAAEAMIQKMKDTHVEIEGSGLTLSLSLGCACKENRETSLHTALQRAEENMYQQKLLDGKSYRNAIISTLLATLYEKSNETEEHSQRIEIYCHAVGRELQLSSREMDELSLLALLHDIGKVGINPNILQKPGALSPAEWVEMKKHPEVGYRIAQATPELAVVADLILSHHEHWDGGGYPRGLKGEEIPLACRILSVVDAFDAMTNDRIYRKAMTVEEAIAEIKRNMGRQFDPEAAELLIRIITDMPL